MQVVELDTGRAQVCRTILEALPAWFGMVESREAYIRSAEELPMLACMADGQAVGFLLLKQHGPLNMEITVMGVLPDWHRKGIGQALIDAAKARAVAAGVPVLSVKTLADHDPDPGYAATRRFYRGVGFELFEELPGLWSEDHPCALFAMLLDRHAD